VFVTSISIWFAPAVATPLRSTAHGAVHTTPSDFPFSRTRAISFTSPAATDPLMRSGLLGPVRIEFGEQRQAFLQINQPE
jgi:hypothetical protein